MACDVNDRRSRFLVAIIDISHERVFLRRGDGTVFVSAYPTPPPPERRFHFRENGETTFGVVPYKNA